MFNTVVLFLFVVCSSAGSVEVEETDTNLRSGFCQEWISVLWNEGGVGTKFLDQVLEN